MPSSRTWKVLFLCTHNSARSILSEALLRHHGEGRFEACSAGSAPAEGQRPHPLGLLALEQAGIDTRGLASKNWTVFSGPHAQPMDLVITVCGSAAGETCPVWPGTPERAHWGHEDPSRVPGSPEQRLAAFHATLEQIRARTLAFVAGSRDLKTSAELGALARRLESHGTV